MRVFTYLAILVWVGLPTTSWGQKQSAARSKNSIEMFFPVSHFFDETTTNWVILAPYKKNVREPDGSYSREDVYILPPTLGLSYIRLLGLKSSINISGTAYMMQYINDNRVPGETMRREYGLISAGYLYKVIAHQQISLYSYGAVNYRFGYERIHIYYPYPWEARVEGLLLRDWGLSAGLRATYDLPWHFLLSGEAKYTQFVYLHDEGVDFFGDHEDPTPHDLTVKIGLGYRF
ncbi:MAG: hypothetical protein R3D00_01560 [Bacteroidia bacterium]